MSHSLYLCLEISLWKAFPPGGKVCWPNFPDQKDEEEEVGKQGGKVNNLEYITLIKGTVSQGFQSQRSAIFSS